jgi:hypothetical protein
MLKIADSEFRTFFLLRFTEELIRNSAKGIPEEDLRIPPPHEQRISLSQESSTKMIGGNFRKSMLRPQFIQNQQTEQKQFFPAPAQQYNKNIFGKKQKLNIPEPKLPERLQYLKPVPTDFFIDLGKINPLIKDPAVKQIECNGPDEKIIVKGLMGEKPVNILLRKDEIDEILNNFSDAAKIPLHEGIFRVAVGKLVLSAVISEILPSKFLIEKMSYNPNIMFPNIRNGR